MLNIWVLGKVTAFFRDVALLLPIAISKVRLYVRMEIRVAVAVAFDPDEFDRKGRYNKRGEIRAGFPLNIIQPNTGNSSISES